MRTIAFLAGLALLASPAAGLAAGNGKDKLRPHIAVYDLILDEASDRSGISSMSGRIVYEVKGSVCAGFTSRFRFFTNVGTPRKAFTSDQRTTTFESPDGKTFNFVTQSYLNGQLEEDRRGEATSRDGGIDVAIKKPEESSVTLEPALFMTQHVARLIEAARDGETIVQAKVYDGSEGGDELVDTTAIIGKPRVVEDAPEREAEEIEANFKGKTAWPVSISYFSTSDADQTGGERLPIYQVSFLMYESGVSRNLTMRYRDYSLKAGLKQLEFYEPESCE